MLSKETCEACRADAPKVSSAEQHALLESLHEDWRIHNEQGVDVLTREIKCKNFVGALDLANKVGDIAEQADHHPRIVVEWGKLTVSWWTHKIGGLHRNDFILAARTDDLLV
ncbi:MAG: 4a-hydroxytetrahydrobiopterin dehydratase [Oleiphilaceae bacterium]|nr:4a-hydroxytetrahydrobiopterin dehydratase [Oleiphilaceae bacterium]